MESCNKGLCLLYCSLPFWAYLLFSGMTVSITLGIPASSQRSPCPGSWPQPVLRDLLGFRAGFCQETRATVSDTKQRSFFWGLPLQNWERLQVGEGARRSVGGVVKITDQLSWVWLRSTGQRCEGILTAGRETYGMPPSLVYSIGWWGQDES